MDESDLYKYALLTCLVGFVSLGALVLFIPISPSEASLFLDGKVMQIYAAQNGVVVIVQEQRQHSFFISKKTNMSKGDMYRFYDVQETKTESDDLVTVEYFRKIS